MSKKDTKREPHKIRDSEVKEIMDKKYKAFGKGDYYLAQEYQGLQNVMEQTGWTAEEAIADLGSKIPKIQKLMEKEESPEL